MFLVGEHVEIPFQRRQPIVERGQLRIPLPRLLLAEEIGPTVEQAISCFRHLTFCAQLAVFVRQCSQLVPLPGLVRIPGRNQSRTVRFCCTGLTARASPRFPEQFSKPFDAPA